MTTSNTLKKTTLRSDEFTCPSCVAKIENKLNGMDGVENATVKFSSGRILVDHDPTKATVKDLVDAVAEVGYTAKPSAI
ncbi:heavy-metal-associated domain-containing protein [Corynebacterium crudilactis]|uniref:Heavy metal transport/detoxification protein n=1 Tax=Corynebacterium crudilactis TaxID=1652495 RepID=A0A172QSX4_9CORY|nr:heavy-metal-associated domain-containing protein [Corynebacterium crudilactis]ANE03748.1 heavy metal transport/detoxification protein [Corynebacterium crudilactis]